MLETGYCHVQTQTAALMISPYPLNECPKLIGWNSVVCLSLSHFVSPFTEQGLCTNSRLFAAHTQDGQLADSEATFPKFDKKHTKQSFTRITDSIFNDHKRRLLCKEVFTQFLVIRSFLIQLWFFLFVLGCFYFNKFMQLFQKFITISG